MKSPRLPRWRRIIASFVVFTFLISNVILPAHYAQAQELFPLPQTLPFLLGQVYPFSSKEYAQSIFSIVGNL